MERDRGIYPAYSGKVGVTGRVLIVGSALTKDLIEWIYEGLQRVLLCLEAVGAVRVREYGAVDFQDITVKTTLAVCVWLRTCTQLK